MYTITTYQTYDEAFPEIEKTIYQNINNINKIQEEGIVNELEMICAINLITFDNNYGYKASIEHLGYPSPCEDEYNTIEKLIKGIKEHVKKYNFKNAVVKPFFYTISEGMDLFNEEEIGNIQMVIDELPENNETINDIKKGIQSFMRYTDIPIKGLDIQDQSLFEKQYLED